jgi:hypothetical protein
LSAVATAGGVADATSQTRSCRAGDVSGTLINPRDNKETDMKQQTDDTIYNSIIHATNAKAIITHRQQQHESPYSLSNSARLERRGDLRLVKTGRRDRLLDTKIWRWVRGEKREVGWT